MLQKLQLVIDKGQSAFEVCQTVLNAGLNSNSEFVVKAASSIVTGISQLGARVPYCGECVGILKDIFAVYQASV
jgi:hypothetical protein